MTTAQFSAAPISDTDTNFRAWGKGLSDALAAVGMVKTADTGQIDWATVTRPTGVSTYQGYEVWRFNDALQATAPLFLKIEYGTGTAPSSPGLRVAAGKGSNGSGTLTGAFGAAISLQFSNPSATPTTSYVSSGDGSLLALALWPGSISLHYFIDRSRDAAGAPTDWAIACNRALSNLSTYVYSSATTFQSFSPAFLPISAPSMTVAGVAPMFPMLCMDGQGHYWQCRALLQYNANDAAVAVPVTVAGWGTYLPAARDYGNTGTNGAIAWF